MLSPSTVNNLTVEAGMPAGVPFCIRDYSDITKGHIIRLRHYQMSRDWKSAPEGMSGERYACMCACACVCVGGAH